MWYSSFWLDLMDRKILWDYPCNLSLSSSSLQVFAFWRHVGMSPCISVYKWLDNISAMPCHLRSVRQIFISSCIISYPTSIFSWVIYSCQDQFISILSHWDHSQLIYIYWKGPASMNLELFILLYIVIVTEGNQYVTMLTMVQTLQWRWWKCLWWCWRR